MIEVVETNYKDKEILVKFTEDWDYHSEEFLIKFSYHNWSYDIDKEGLRVSVIMGSYEPEFLLWETLLKLSHFAAQLEEKLKKGCRFDDLMGESYE